MLREGADVAVLVVLLLSTGSGPSGHRFAKPIAEGAAGGGSGLRGLFVPFAGYGRCCQRGVEGVGALVTAQRHRCKVLGMLGTSRPQNIGFITQDDAQTPLGTSVSQQRVWAPIL